MRMYGWGGACVALCLAACGGGSGGGEAGDGGGGDPVVTSSLLKAASGAELEQSLKQALATPTARVELSLAPVAGDAAGGFSGTYTVEPRVDEMDAVRYDGEHLYIAPQRFVSCCFVVDALLPPEPPDTGGSRAIRILRTDPATASAAEVGSIPLEDGVSVQGLYVAGARLFALTGAAFYGSYGGFWSDIAIWAPEQAGFRIYDVSRPEAPALEASASLDGVFVDSRRIGDTVYLVSRFTPGLPVLELPVQDAAQAARNEAALAALEIGDLLPTLTLDGTTRPLVDADDCFIATDAARSPHAVLTTITAIPLDRPEAYRSLCYNEEAYGLYASEDAIYLTQLIFPGSATSGRTRIHKFALDGTAADYRGSVEIAGQVWTGGQSDFRLSERDGVLRVFATTYTATAGDPLDHHLLTLRETAAGGALEVIGELPNTRRPAAIGKPGEALYGVRFVEDRAYAVTFLQRDPLYVFDMADPADPLATGQLEVTGFSDLLHPVGAGLLLGLGAADTGGVKLELFDVSDPANPRSRGSEVLGGAGSYSDARHDRHAFTYLADGGGNGIDRLAIPAVVSDPVAAGAPPRSALYLFEIVGTGDPATASLQAAGAVAPDDGGSPGFRHRAFLHGESVFYVRDSVAWGALWATASSPVGPF
ncbi:MAG: beta-propeller domain-containing protein [Rhodocyclaceae bacterium]|nr:beta-propeller domain-containing protein [Rhodocyclaceae bacterium]